MALRLESDFHDYYDLWFDRRADAVLRRVTTDGPNRAEMFRLMAAAGYDVPPHGLAEGLPSDDRQVVVYIDERAHRGDGKIVCTARYARGLHPECLSAEYIPEPRGVSWRYLQVGLKRFWLEYRNPGGWRSNVGDDVDVSVFCQETDGLHPFFRLPLFAIDFVPGQKLWAVDLNVAPGVRGSGVEKVLSGMDAAASIEEAFGLLSRG